LSDKYQIAETETFHKTLKKNKSLQTVYRRVVEIVYPMLRREPHFGPNIKRLRGELSDFYRYRIGDDRLFYTIEENDVIVVVADLRSRQDAYRK
jgi:mRNA interferase RelE/StbE